MDPTLSWHIYRRLVPTCFAIVLLGSTGLVLSPSPVEAARNRTKRASGKSTAKPNKPASVTKKASNSKPAKAGNTKLSKVSPKDNSGKQPGRKYHKHDPKKKVDPTPKRRPAPPNTPGAMPALGEGVLTKKEEFAIAETMEIRDVRLWAEIIRNPKNADILLAKLPAYLEAAKSKTYGQSEKNAAQQIFDAKLAERTLSNARKSLEAGKLTPDQSRELAISLRHTDLDRLALLEILADIRTSAPNSEKAYLNTLRTLENEANAVRELFSERNRGLVNDVVNNMVIPLHIAVDDVARDEIVQEAFQGLAKAVNRFDRHRGFKLSTFGSWWIRSSAQDEITLKARPDREGMSPKATSFESTDDEDAPRIEPVSRVADPSDDAIHNEHLELALAKLDNLEPLEREIVVLRIGLDGKGSQSFREIADILAPSIAKSSVPVIFHRAMRKLKEDMGLFEPPN